MKYKSISNTKKYLLRFDEIVNEMADKMLSPNIVNNITLNFIQCMIPHHQAAIYMCENLLKYTYYKPLENIANKIIRMQTRGIEQMRNIENTTRGYENNSKDVDCYMEKYFEITNKMIYKMRNSPRCYSINLDFVNEMIPHHEGAISMCENLLKYDIDPRLVKVARNIIEEQSRGVEELKDIKEKLCKY